MLLSFIDKKKNEIFFLIFDYYFISIKTGHYKCDLHKKKYFYYKKLDLIFLANSI